MKKIFYLLVFSTNLVIAQNWFPLEVGNKWQMFGSTDYQGATHWWINNLVINADTIIDGLRYYRHTAGIFRYDTVGQKLFIYAFNGNINKFMEGLYMDFNLSNNSTFIQFIGGGSVSHPNSYRSVKVVETNYSFLGRSWNVKGFNYNIYPYYESGYWASNFGYIYGTPIQAQFYLNDRLLTYDHGYYPIISFTPINQVSSNHFIANFSASHYYTRWSPGGGPGSFNYIESIILLGQYQKGDSIYPFTPVSASIGYGNECTFNFSLNLELLKRQYVFNYKLQAKDKGLIQHYSNCPNTGYFSLVYVDTLTNVFENENAPYDFTLYQNYPNPFNPSTKIKYAISSPQYATLKVYDILGNEVATLVDEYKPAGNYEIEFNAVETLHATSLPSGLYFYQLKAGEFVETKKMILLR